MKTATAAPQTKILIAAKTYGHASHCAKKRGLGPLEWAYVDGGHKLQGSRGARVILYETWRQHPESHIVAEMLKHLECVTEECNG